MDSSPASMWSSIVKKDPPSKPPTTDVAPAAILGMVGNCKSTKGIEMAIVDANAVTDGRQGLTDFADKFVTVPEVLSEIRDSDSRRRLEFIPFTIETMEPSPESLSKDLKLIALTYTLEAEVHGTKNLRDVPPPIQTVRVKRLPEKELPGWGSNVANLEEWEALENETEEKSNTASKILPLKDLNMNILPSDSCSEVGSVVSHTEDDEEGERRQKRYPPKKTEVKVDVLYSIAYGCSVTPEIGRIFCPKCGNGGTLRKVAVTIGENGTIIAARKPRVTLRGTKVSSQKLNGNNHFSIPMPKSGRDAITKNLVLREDQLPQKHLHPKTKKKASKPGDEYFISDDVFMHHHSDRKAPLQPPVRKAMAVFSQKRNPNDNHYSRSMHC
ncbi:hypothetical protein YC2023_077291 [Brassica napus]